MAETKWDPMEIAEERIEEARRTGATKLDLSGLVLTSLPEAIGQLTNLTTLYLLGIHLTALPEAFGQLTNLTALDLGYNQLTSFPEAIGRLTNLTSLDLRNNQLTSLPESIGRLTNLTELYLIGNQLTSLPESIGRLTNLTELYLHDNDQLGIPPEVLGPTSTLVLLVGDIKPAKPADILAYYFRTRQKSRPLLEAKIILLGRGEVGKTSLVKRLVSNTFDPREPITHGLNITRWPVKSRLGPVTLRVWDFGGQEIMHATHQCFLTERTLYLVVVEGRRGLADADAEYWLRFIQTFGGDSPVIVVLNKVGRFRYDVKRSELLQKFPNIKAFIETDCADDLGIDQLRKRMTKELGELPSLRVKFPAAWFAIKDRLAQMSEHYLGFEQFEALCSELGEKDATAQEQLAGYLHALGIALNYRDDSRLNDKHILNPNWVTAGIYALITAPTLAAQGGVLHPRDLTAILDAKTYPRSMHQYLLDLMRKFDLCFELPDESDRYLVPELLSIQEPAEASRFKPEACLNFEYRYTFLPEGFLPRFIARTHWHSTNRPRWRTGVLLAFDGAEALVMAEAESRRVIVRVQGTVERRRSLLALVRSELDQIHSIFRANPPEAWVPIPGHPSEAIAYQELLDFEKEGDLTLKRSIAGKIVRLDVTELLNGVDLPGTRRRADHRERQTVRVFVSYAHRDETHKATLGGHLLPLVQEGLIQWWDDRHLRPGDDWAGDIDRNLNEADVVLLLVSRHFLASNYCRNIETPAALAGSALVVPIILDDADTTGQPFMSRQVLPTDNRPILLAKHWPDANDGWRQVADRLRDVVRNRFAG